MDAQEAHAFPNNVIDMTSYACIIKASSIITYVERNLVLLLLDYLFKRKEKNIVFYTFIWRPNASESFPSFCLE